MPVIEINLRDLQALLGTNLKDYDLEELFSYLKAEIEEQVATTVKLEMKDTNRPDLWSVEGIARELKGILEIETGLPVYKVHPGEKDFQIFVDEKLKEIRPYIVSAVVKGVKLGEDGLQSIIQLQDKIMESYGRRRKKIAIGTSNLDLIEFPIYYKAVKPEDISFVPLYESRKMNLKEILEETEKGQRYRYILQGKKYYPILVDSKGSVISFPPIINSNDIGRIDADTRNIFIDVTGTDLKACLTALNALVTALADRKGRIYSVKIIYPDREIVTPNLEPKEIKVDPEYIRKLSGINFANRELIDLLKRKRFDIKFDDQGNLIVRWIPYRDDILGPQDILEEVLISYGFNLISPRKPRIYTEGEELDIKRFIDLLREIMVGLGCIEIYNPVISSTDIQLRNINVNRKVVEIENPVSKNYNCLRWSLLPQALEFFAYNKKEELPQEIFEIGEVVEYNTVIDEHYNLLYALTDYKLTITDAKERLESLMRALGLEYNLEYYDLPYAIPGRSAKIFVKTIPVGYIGEIHPKILENFDIPTPVVFFEINVDKLFNIYQLEMKKK